MEKSLYLLLNYLNEFRWGKGAEEMDQEKKKILLLETPFDLIACAQQSASAALNFYELPSSPLKPQAPSTSLSSGSFLRPQLPYLLSSFTSSGASLQRWLSGKTICLPVLETQETLVRSLGGEDPLEKEVANPHQYSCLENFNGQRSVVGYRPWGLERVRDNRARTRRQN